MKGNKTMENITKILETAVIEGELVLKFLSTDDKTLVLIFTKEMALDLAKFITTAFKP